MEIFSEAALSQQCTYCGQEGWPGHSVIAEPSKGGSHHVPHMDLVVRCFRCGSEIKRYMPLCAKAIV
jgi:hypothetical protein